MMNFYAFRPGEPTPSKLDGFEEAIELAEYYAALEVDFIMAMVTDTLDDHLDEIDDILRMEEHDVDYGAARPYAYDDIEVLSFDEYDNRGN